MTRQVTAINWKIKEVLFDQPTQKFTEKSKKFGRYTSRQSLIMALVVIG